MTKISQLADIGANLAGDDEFVIRDVSDTSTPNKKVTASGFLSIGSALGIFNTDRITAGDAATGTQTRLYASGISGYSETTISGIPSARTTVSGYFENASGVVSGVFFPVATQTDIGTAPNQLPLNGMLGDMAFASYPFWRGGSDTTTTSGTVTIDALSYERFNYTASMATGVTVQFSNMLNGREVKLYLRNTNATARPVTFLASTSGTGHTAIPLALGSPTGGPSGSGITLSGTTGTAMVWVGNINGTIVGGMI
jgi:hypothetical protein